MIGKKTMAGIMAGSVLLAAVPGVTLAKGHGHANGKTTQTANATGTTKGARAGKAGRNLVLGTLTSFNDTSATIATTGGTQATLALTAGTRYVAHRQAAAVAGLKNGEQVAVTTVTNGTTTQAAVLEFDTAPFGVPVRLAGTLASSTSTSLNVTTSSGNVTVQTNSATVYIVNGNKATSLPASAQGQEVVIAAQAMTSGGIVARTVAIGQSSVARSHRVIVRGSIASFSGTQLSITVQQGAAPVVVQLTTTTKYIVKGVAATSAPAFAANQQVVVLATRQADGSLVANVVSIR